jgi:alkanesulfonate monooxygenase SsuD/methylene tetrahydromethanopterin reductase-like flavin-dependent oxidoreductase (luciferase family)
MKRIATISPVLGCSVEELRTLAQLAEDAGFEAILSPEFPILASFPAGGESHVDVMKKTVNAYSD